MRTLSGRFGGAIVDVLDVWGTYVQHQNGNTQLEEMSWCDFIGNKLIIWLGLILVEYRCGCGYLKFGKITSWFLVDLQTKSNKPKKSCVFFLHFWQGISGSTSAPQEVKGDMPLCRCSGHCKCGLADALGRARDDRKMQAAQPATYNKLGCWLMFSLCWMDLCKKNVFGCVWWFYDSWQDEKQWRKQHGPRPCTSAIFIRRFLSLVEQLNVEMQPETIISHFRLRAGSGNGTRHTWNHQPVETRNDHGCMRVWYLIKYHSVSFGFIMLSTDDEVTKHFRLISDWSWWLYVFQEEVLYGFFTPVAPVATVRVVRDTKTMESEQHGYVNFYTFQDAQKVLQTLDGHVIHGRRSLVWMRSISVTPQLTEIEEWCQCRVRGSSVHAKSGSSVHAKRGSSVHAKHVSCSWTVPCS